MMTKRMLGFCLLAATLVAAPISAFADRNAVQFGTNINVARDAEVHDAVCFFCSVNAEGTVDGNVVVFFGNIHIAGQANHDVVNFFGKVSVDDGASIANNLVSFFGGIKLGQDASVGHDLVVMFGDLSAAPSATVGHNRVYQPIWILFAPLGFLALIIFAIVEGFRAHRRRLLLASYPFPPPPHR